MSNLVTNETIVREFYQQYHARNREALATMMHPEFEFTSPYDDHIDRLEYFARCWDGGDRMSDFEIERIAATGQFVFVNYTLTFDNGSTAHNCEIFTIEDDKVRAVEVFFGEPTTQAGSKAA